MRKIRNRFKQNIANGNLTVQKIGKLLLNYKNIVNNNKKIILYSQVNKNSTKNFGGSLYYKRFNQSYLRIIIIESHQNIRNKLFIY